MGNAAWVKSGVSGGVGEMTPLGQDGSGSFRGGGNGGGWTGWAVDSVGRARVAGLSSVRGHSNGHGVWVAPTRSGFGRLDPLSCCCARPGSGRGGWRGGPTLAILRADCLCSGSPILLIVGMAMAVSGLDCWSSGLGVCPGTCSSTSMDGSGLGKFHD